MSLTSNTQPWAVVLAGGDGTRLQSLTRTIAGDSRPKQFCRLYGGKTLLRQTCDRIERLFPRDRTLFVVTKKHKAFYAEELCGTDSSAVLAQPQNRGTGVAMAAALLRIRQADRGAVVAFFPSDHYYSDDDAFRSAIGTAVLCARMQEHSIILLGAEAHHPEAEYGWIEPGAAIVNTAMTKLLRVSRFWEKPSFTQAQNLLRGGCLWNTFVTIGTVGAFLDLLNSQVSDVVHHLAASVQKSDLAAAYEGVRAVDFSREVLTPRTDRLLVLRDSASGWADLGNPSRLIDTLVRNHVEADWLSQMPVALPG